jgi:hypothetical protein
MVAGEIEMPWVDEEKLSAEMPPKKQEADEALKYVARKAKVRFLADETSRRGRWRSCARWGQRW